MSLRERKIDVLVPKLLRWFAEAARDLPWRRTMDPYCIWVSEIMLQQTQVRTVLPYYERWMRALPDVAALAGADAQTVHKLWEGLGYYTRARNLQQAARKILQEHGGRFPSEFEAILDLPGVGPYTAGAIASIAFGQAAPVLDGNVARVLARLFAVEGDPRERPAKARLWELAGQLVRGAERVPARGARFPCGDLNESLMEMGALICTPRDPGCGRCPVSRHCQARQEKRVAELPAPRPAAAPTARTFYAFVLSRRGKCLVRQRAPGVVNGQLWEFPNLEVADGESPAAAAQRLFGPGRCQLEGLVTIRHSITRYRITLQAFVVRGAGPRFARGAPGRWAGRRELEALPFPSAHRQIVRALLR